MVMKSIKETLLERVDDVRSGMNSLRSSDYGDVFFWQEVCSLADKKLKDAWAFIQDQKGNIKIKDDDSMRALGEGEHVVMSSKLFTVMAKVATARKNLDLTELKAGIIEAYPQVREKKLDAIIEAARVPGKNQLTKRVVENVR